MHFARSSPLLLLPKHSFFFFLSRGTSFPSVHSNSRRAFLLPASPPLHLSASLTLPYARAPLFALIADIPSYPSFLPYLRTATVTEQSDPVAAEGLDDHSQRTSLTLDPRRWPRAADLHIAWKGYECVFRSRVECIPEHSVEAVSAGEDGGDVFDDLRTRWTLTDIPTKAGELGAGPRTEVRLAIDARFRSALLGALSQAAAPKVAGLVMDAFERRAREVLGEGREIRGEGNGRGGR
jgi:coenzyme Q-binding protein COQ10